MELSEIIALEPDELNDETKHEVFEVLSAIENVENIPRKNLRKALAICLSIMKFKGEQVNNLQEQLETKTQPDSGDESRSDRIHDENERLKQLVNKLEEDKNSLKAKMKELTEETIHLQKRLTEAMKSNESDKDSSDPLSELDRQEELLKNINVKNKHIKRLLREIEALQTNNIEQSKTIIDLEKRQQRFKSQLQDLNSKIVLLEGEKNALSDTVNELNAEVTRLEGNITYLEDERDKTEANQKRLIEKLEVKAKTWRTTIGEKDKEIKKLKSKMESLSENSPKNEHEEDEEPSDNDKERIAEESARMMHAIEVRDKVIEEMESKIKSMAEEMISSTRVMNKLSAEREDELSLGSKRSRQCCRTVEESLKACNDRCRSLSEMLERSEEDNMLRSQQAAEAMAALDAYQRGDDGLSKALKKISSLEEKINSREKQIRALVLELNAMHEISSENTILRKKLKIPDDVVITAKNATAKERNKDKQIERLALKLRASEEMRLRLKLEKSDLRKQIIELQNTPRIPETPTTGGVQSSVQSPDGKSRPEIYCDNCLKNIQSLPNKDAVMQDVIKEWENKYSDVIEENENLRVGMHEILEKIREYDATSDHITIDCEILERLLHALDARSISGWYHPAMRIQNELIALKEREHALREKINAVKDDQFPQESVDEIREQGEVPESSVESIPVMVFDSSTRPTTPNKSLDQSLYPVIVEADIEHESMKSEFLRTLEKNRSLQQEIQRLQVFQAHFEELSSQMAASESDVTKYCSVLVEKFSALEIQLNTKNKAYEFLKEDFERTLSDSKASEMRNMTLIADLKKQVNDRKHDISLLKAEKERLLQRTTLCNSDEYAEMQRSLFNLQSQLASLIDQVFSGKVPDLKIDDVSADYGVIQDNLQLDFLTVQEYDDMQREKAEFETREKDLQIRCEHLEGLLTISNEQITSQQKLLTEITDNHINLRHLVADLQSSSEDKFLIAKIQRELDSAKTEISSLKLDLEIYEQNEEVLKKEIKEKDRKLDAATQRFQNHLNNVVIKSKFLQQALRNLRQKYIKFTPLIFLSNFIYSYAKFVKHSKKEEENLHERLLGQVEEILSSTVETSPGGDNESQDRIKLIKTETKAKFLEDRLQVMVRKNVSLQSELDELRLAVANESEQWKTIEALFGDENKERTTVENEVQTEGIEIVDSTTNTEGKEDALPVEREAVSTVDKNLSPIASPTRKEAENSNAETQTSAIVMVSKQTSPVTSPIKQSEGVKQTSPVGSPIKQLEGVKQTSKVGSPGKQAEEIKQKSPVGSPIKQLELVARPSMESQGIQASLTEPQTTVATDSRGIQTSPVASPQRQHPPTQDDSKIQELANQLKEVKALAEDRKERLEKAEIGLQESQRSIEEMRQTLQEQQEKKDKQKSSDTEEKTSYQAGVIEKTILSFHSLLSEKDKSINQYQELLTSERVQNDAACLKYKSEMERLTQSIKNLSADIKAKDEEILELKTQIEATRRTTKEKSEIATGVDDNGDNSLQEISDEKIEEMFNDDGVSEVSERKPIEMSKNIYLRELKNKEKFWENTLKIKEDEIAMMKEKLHMYQERDKIDSGMNPEMEQLRTLLEEKDKHINDLMDTLANFHDDQQRFLTDSSTYSADQISKLAANLNRSDAANKIYQAQLEALRRQLANLNQREKQARDLNNTLRNQLIKRPVVSIKTELNARLKTENLQKKVNQLEGELEESQMQIKRMQAIIEAKRARSNNEVGLWEKQKRWQQSAEKFKAKLEEAEGTLEKQKALLNSARTTIARLEKDKQILEARVGKNCGGLKCCRTPSCPNLQATKYTPSETPETYTGGSECSSPARGLHFLHNNHSELIDALKARIELQQRKIIAMEMEGKGNNALTTELQKLQEKYSAIEAQNIRLEARNLQLQLDNDLLRQGDSAERMEKRVKHLEDYIIALKEELAQAEARRELNFDPKQERKYSPGQAEQTILSLRGIIEKLRVDNKFLKEGRKLTEQKEPETCPTELKRLQNMYTESLDKISALQIELQLKARCPSCGNKSHLETFSNDELRSIKEQLVKKTQLLEKAKILLTRAAAKEKVLKEQLSLWKRKCSELQNVPVIDEISE